MEDSAITKSEPKKNKDPLSYVFSADYFSQAVKHPFITAAIISLACFSLTTSGINIITLCVIYSGVLIAAVAALLPRFIKSPVPVKIAMFIGTVGVSYGISYYLSYCVNVAQNISSAVINIGLAIAAALLLYFGITGTLTINKLIVLILFAGFVIRLSYDLNISCMFIQHDVYRVEKEHGHAYYIKYLYDNGHLADFDVRDIDQFYHPPFHHIIAALWVRLQTLLGLEFDKALENVQLLTLFYSSACMILSYKIFRRLGLKDAGLVTATAVIAFCPTFYIMAGSINNDILSIALFLGAVYNTICWYQKQTFRRIIAIALCIGLGMFTKLSVWMVAPAVAFIFIFVFFKNLRNFKRLLLQFASFLGICVPIAFFWSVRNYVSYGVPFTFVQRLSEKSSQYVGDIPIMTRLFDFSPYQFEQVSEQFKYKGTYNDFNPLVGFFKTSAFDEGINAQNFPSITGLDKLLFWSVAVVGLIGFAAMIYMFCKKSETITIPMKIFIGGIYAVVFGSYYIFCIGFPHVCTMNVRYGVPLIVIGALSIGFLICQTTKSDKKWKKIIGNLSIGAVVVYFISGLLVFHSVCTVTIK